MKKLNADKIIALVSAYNSLTPIGMALEGFSILSMIDKEVGDNDLRATVFSWID